jgi:hypothetical protein
MRTTNTIRNFILAAFALLLFSTVAVAQTTEFTYQGHIKNGGTPANGSYDFEFALFDDLSAGSQFGLTLTRLSVPVAGGVFSVKLDFGSNFPGANRFLEIRVKQTGGGGFTLLTPRQSVSSAPYAVQSLNATNAINATTAVTATNATNATTATNATQLNGQGPSFYQNAANLNSGTLADARLSSNVAMLAGTQTFSGPKTFSAPSVFNSTVGIGTASPLRALSIVGGLVVDQGNQNPSDTNTFGINFGTVGTGIASNRSGAGLNLNGLNFYAGDNSFPRMSLTTSGQLGLGTSTPSAMLHVNGTAFVSDSITTGAYFGSGAALTALNASNISTGTLPNGRLAGSYTGALTLSNTGNAFTGVFTGTGTGFTGSGAGLTTLNASNLSTGSLADARLSGNVAFLSGFQTFSGNKSFDASTTFNAPVTVNGPGERLEIRGSDATVRIFNTNDTGGGYIQDSFGTLQLGMFNPSAAPFGQVPAGGKRAFFAAGADGRVGSTTNLNSGNPVYRNLLDDGIGNASISGNISTSGSISSINFPRAKVVQTYRDVRDINAGVIILSGQSPNINSITVNIPSSGVLMLRATIQLFVDNIEVDPAQNAFFKLSDNTAGPVTLCETNYGYDKTGPGLSVTSTFGTLIVDWTVNVNAGTRTYGTSLFNDSTGFIRYFSTSLQAIFIPAGL